MKSRIGAKGDTKVQCVVCDEKIPGPELENHYDEVHGWKLRVTPEDRWLSFEEVDLINQPKLLREWSHDQNCLAEGTRNIQEGELKMNYVFKPPL